MINSALFSKTQPAMWKISDDTKGGFHPICLGDVISHGASYNKSVPTADSSPQHYRILHKLGRGEFATVWFAQALHEYS